MIRKLTYLLMAAIAVFLVAAAMQPAEFRVTRTAKMNASPAAVYAQVNNLHSWENWSPWNDVDPKATMHYEGPDSGVGAAFSWAGNKDVGVGTMTITESTPNELVRFRLDFEKPWAMTSMSDLTFVQEGDHTVVAWSMYGHKDFIGKAMGLLFNCDKEVGKMYDKGLGTLKKIVESA